MTDLPDLTPADLAALRASARGLPRDSVGPFALAAALRYNPLRAEWQLLAHGTPIACAAAPTALLALMLRDARDPGFIGRALSPLLDPETALQSSTAYALALDRRHSLDAQSRAEVEAAREARRVSLYDPAKLELDDL